MAISSEFQRALSEQDVVMAHIMLKDSLVLDPSFRDFNAMLAAAEAALPDLYAADDGEPLSNDISTWTKEYMDKQMVKLMGNFSKEKIQHLKAVCRHRYSDRVEKIETERFVEAHKTPAVTRKQIGTGVAIGGAVTAVIGIAAAKPVIIALGAAVVIAGGILIITDK